MKRTELIEVIADKFLELYGGAEDEWETQRKASEMRRLKLAAMAVDAMEKTDILADYIYDKETV